MWRTSTSEQRDERAALHACHRIFYPLERVFRTISTAQNERMAFAQTQTGLGFIVGLVLS
jgi:hypothetical protein